MRGRTWAAVWTSAACAMACGSGISSDKQDPVSADASCPTAEAGDVTIDAGSETRDSGAEAGACATTPSTQTACFDSPTFAFGASVDSDSCVGPQLDAFFTRERDRGFDCYRPSTVHPAAHVWCCGAGDPCADTMLTREGCGEASAPHDRTALSACFVRYDGCVVEGDFLCCSQRPDGGA